MLLKRTRRDFLKAAVIASVGATVASCTPQVENPTVAAPATKAVEEAVPATKAVEAAAPTAQVVEAAEPATKAAKDPVELKLFVDAVWWPVKEWKGSIPEAATAITGVRPIVTVAVDTTAIDLLIASGDLGDLVLAEPLHYNRLNDSNLCYDLDSLAEQYGIDLSQIHSVSRFVNTADDGKMYAQCVGFSPPSEMERMKGLVEGRGLVCRTDIMEELGYKEEDIQTIDDLEELLSKVKEAHPDMIPFVFNNTNLDNGMMKNLHGATYEQTGFVSMGDELYAFLAHPPLKDYFMRMNKWYRLGFMTDENFGWTTALDGEYMVSGKAFADSNYGGTARTMNLTTLPEAGADFNVTQMISIYRGQPGAEVIEMRAGWRWLFIPKSCSDPEAALRFLLWAYSLEGQTHLLYGREGIDWEWSEDGTYPQLKWDFSKPNQDEGYKYWGWISHNGWQNSNVEKSNPDSTTLAAYEAITSITRRDTVCALITMAPDSRQAQIMDSLEELYQQGKTEIITAPTEADAEAAYNKMIETANKVGMQELLEWAKPKYAEKAAEYDRIKNNEK